MFELAHLAAVLSTSLNKPADDCFDEAAELYRRAKLWLGGVDEYGPAEEYEHGEEVLLKGTRKLHNRFPEIEIDLEVVASGRVPGDVESREDKIACRALTTWRGLRKAVDRLIGEGIMESYEVAVTDVVERRKLSRATIRDINRARVYSESAKAAKRLGAISWLARYAEPESGQPQRVRSKPEVQKGTGSRRSGTGTPASGRILDDPWEIVRQTRNNFRKTRNSDRK